MKKSFSDILSSLESAKDDKLREKLPSWAAAFTLQDTKGGYCVQDFPKLSLEQCSSELTALYKAGLAEALMEGRKGTLCDLCCGLGADSWAFSKVCSRVDAFEADSSLAPKTAAHLSALGADNVFVLNALSGPGMALGSYDIIYADPARRDRSAKKVALPQD